MDDNSYPLSWYEEKPHIHAVRINAPRPDGIPDGVHCGAWHVITEPYPSTKGEVWKSLYGRPFINAEVLYETREVEFLTTFAGQPFFPKNWEVRETKGRRKWLVRKQAYVYHKADDYMHIHQETLLALEQAVLNVNRAGWMLNDDIILAFDEDDYNPFIVDCSTACTRYPHETDWNHIRKLFKTAGRDNLIAFRESSQQILIDIRTAKRLHQDDNTLPEFMPLHVYGSFYRPFSFMWASLPIQAFLVHNDRMNVEKGIPLTFILTEQEIPAEKIASYELQWGWSRID